MRARDNPFSADRLHRVPLCLAGCEWRGLLDRLSKPGFRGAIVGPHGSGKTTLLAALEAHLTARGYVVRHLRLTEDRRRISPSANRDPTFALGPRNVICLDGAEQMPAVRWHLFRRRTRRAGGLLITSHQPGRLPTLIRCTTTPELLGTIVASLLSDATSQAEPVRVPLLPDTRELFARHAGDIRSALRELYDRCAAIIPAPATPLDGAAGDRLMRFTGWS